MKIIFAGTPDFAVLPLKKIAEQRNVCAVLTQPDKPQGRKGILTPPPVKVVAEELGIKVLQPDNLTESIEEIKALGADLMVTCAYGKILKQELLDLFPMGVWNIHASLLPAYRGAAPIPRAIMDGLSETGVTIMKTELGLDTGDMLLSDSLKIEKTDTCKTLSEKLSCLAGGLIIDALAKIESGNFTLQKQGEGTLCKKVQRTEVDFSKSAAEVSALIRGLAPSPLSFGVAEGQIFNFYMAEEIVCEGEEPFGTVLAASPKEGLIVKCGKGAVNITRIQPAGGKEMSARDFLNGRKLTKGQRFENQSLL